MILESTLGSKIFCDLVILNTQILPLSRFQNNSSTFSSPIPLCPLLNSRFYSSIVEPACFLHKSDCGNVQDEKLPWRVGRQLCVGRHHATQLSSAQLRQAQRADQRRPGEWAEGGQRVGRQLCVVDRCAELHICPHKEEIKEEVDKSLGQTSRPKRLGNRCNGGFEDACMERVR
jgi:hypothetical protein